MKIIFQMRTWMAAGDTIRHELSEAERSEIEMISLEKMITNKMIQVTTPL